MTNLRFLFGEERVLGRIIGDVPQMGLGGQIDVRNRVWLAPDRTPQQAQQRIQQFNGSQQITFGLAQPVVFQPHLSVSSHPSVLGMYRPPSIQPVYAFGLPQGMSRPQLSPSLSPAASVQQSSVRPEQAPLVQLAQAPAQPRGFGQPHPAQQLQQYPPAGYPHDSRGNIGRPVFSPALTPDHPDNPNRVPVLPRSVTSAPAAPVTPQPSVGFPVFGPAGDRPDLRPGYRPNPSPTREEMYKQKRQAAATAEIQGQRKESERLQQELRKLDEEGGKLQKQMQDVRTRMDRVRKEMNERVEKNDQESAKNRKELQARRKELQQTFEAAQKSGDLGSVLAVNERVQLLVKQIEDTQAAMKTYLAATEKQLEELETLLTTVEASNKNLQQRRKTLLAQIETATRRIEQLTKNMPR